MAPLRSPNPLRRRLLIAGAAALPAACTSPVPQLAPPATPPPQPQVRVGQRWHYETIELYRGSRVSDFYAEVTRDSGGGPAPLAVVLSDPQGVRIAEEQWTSPWTVVVDPSYDRPQIFEAPMPYLPDRLEPGSARKDFTHYGVADFSARLYWGQRLRATGWERIEVPAGTFDALRVERYINFEHWDTWRAHPWRVDVLWYAPAVERWVQRDWYGQYYWPSKRPVEAEENRIRWRLLDWAAV